MEKHSSETVDFNYIKKKVLNNALNNPAISKIY